MQLKKSKEEEVLKVYETWLQSYISGDVKTYDSFLDDDYHFIGSATKEEFLNRKLKENSHADTDEVITDLILKRELQKVIIRELYSSS